MAAAASYGAGAGTRASFGGNVCPLTLCEALAALMGLLGCGPAI